MRMPMGLAVGRLLTIWAEMLAQKVGRAAAVDDGDGIRRGKLVVGGPTILVVTVEKQLIPDALLGM